MRMKRTWRATTALPLVTALAMGLAGAVPLLGSASAAPAVKGGAALAKKHAAKKHAKRHAGKTRGVKGKKRGGGHGKGRGGGALPGLDVKYREKGGTKAIESESQIPLAPAFTPKQLEAQPSGNMITPEGGATGDQYSQLDEITPANVAKLKPDWMTQLDGSGIGLQYSEEAAPTEYKGVIYYETGADDVFAVSVASGKILWVHKGELPSTTAAAVCCGWDSRGVALGDGLVYAPVLSGSVEALNQKTGALVWETELGEPLEGFTVTSAPLYYHGMVFIGPVGAEYATRGYMAAYDAKTGAMIWKHYNIPAPGEPGHSTWPTGTPCKECDNEWEHGGATTWNAPTVDPKLGLIYYSTANAGGLGGDYAGQTRAGMDLWTVSMLALNYKTGEMSWGYQEVHHDIWDYDASVHPDMVDVTIHGKHVEGIVQTDKNGYNYFVDAKTGKPVFPIPEEEIPAPITNDQEQVYPTQPVPSVIPPQNPMKPSPAIMAELEKGLAESAAADHVPTPTINPESGWQGDWVFSAIGVVGEPSIQGSSGGNSGAREAPTSYDPKNGYMYVCSNQLLSVKAEAPVGQTAIHGLSGRENPNSAKGYITAYNMHTGEKVWQDEWPEQCYSGNVSTAGGILFVGNEEGKLIAYDGSSGKELWSFETGAGADAPVGVYEFKGKEYVTIMSGGNARSLTTSVHGDNLWTFSLNATGGPAPIPLGQTPPPAEELGGNTACPNKETTC